MMCLYVSQVLLLMEKIIEKYSTCFNNTTGKFYQGFGTLHHNGYCRLKIKKPLCYFDFMVGNYNVNTEQDNLRKFTNL